MKLWQISELTGKIILLIAVMIQLIEISNQSDSIIEQTDDMIIGMQSAHMQGNISEIISNRFWIIQNSLLICELSQMCEGDQIDILKEESDSVISRSAELSEGISGIIDFGGRTNSSVDAIREARHRANLLFISLFVLGTLLVIGARVVELRKTNKDG